MAAAPSNARAETGEPRLGESHASLNERVRDAIKQAIIAGEYKPGDRLVEGRLADRFGVSRNPVREALKTLDTEGIVEIIPRRGAFVTALDDDEIREIVELRAVLEGIGARFASQHLSAKAVEALPAILKEGEVAVANKDLAALSELNDKFHNALAEASSNRFLTDFIGTLRGKTHWLFAGISQERAMRSWGEHAAIMRAVIEGDADMAELLASRHVSNVGRDLLSGELSSNDIPEEDEDV